MIDHIWALSPLGCGPANALPIDIPVEHEKRHSEPRSLLLSNCSTDSLRILYGLDG